MTTSDVATMINLLDFDQAAMTALFAERGEKPFRAKQALRWVHHGLADRVDAMTDLAKATRDALARDAEIRAPAVVRDAAASDGTRKWLLDVGGANAIEAVYIPEDDRGTLCISSQAGCALDCAFCSTGKQGFNRNSGVGEIIGQLWHANRALLADGVAAPWVEHGRHPITNVVMMGMGEPLANFDNVVAALHIMLDDNAYGLSRRRVTLSTSGMVPAIDRLRDACPVALAVSLHAPNDALRDRAGSDQPQISARGAAGRVPALHRKGAARFRDLRIRDARPRQRRAEHARELVALVRDVPCKFNLIPFNPFPNTEFATSSRTRILAFQRILRDAGLVATIRKTRGEDIDAACGQLAGQVQDRTAPHAQDPARRGSHRDCLP